jgi:C4-dicarboxylate-specific signal transduction histidine kinase
VGTLSKIASLELKQSAGNQQPETADLNEVLTDLRIVLEPSCAESDILVQWDIPGNLPLVEADRHSLLQVLLNLSKNSQRALEAVPNDDAATNKVIHISACAGPSGVSVRFTDSGPGISPGQRLFQPLQKGADGAGLGLYLSRAFMRSFRGDLRHDPQHPGCSFVLELAAGNAAHTTLTA